MRHGRVFSRLEASCALHLRRSFQTCRFVPRNIAAIAASTGARSLSRRRFLSSLALAGARRKVKRQEGRRVEVLKQNQFSPLPFSKQILIIFAGTNGFLDDLPVDQVRDFEAEVYKYVDTSNPGLLRSIMEKKILDDNLKAEMTKVLKECKETFAAERQTVAAK